MALLVAAVGAGASWAPPAVPLKCDACARDWAGNVVCTKARAAAPDPVAQGCCKKGDRQTPSRPQPASPMPHGCDGKCSQCCLPAVHEAPVLTGLEFIEAPSAANDSVHVEPPSGPTSAVHSSIFHPPRA